MMRWIGFAILVYLLMLLQTTLGKLLTFPLESLGVVGPDLSAIVAVFLAMRVRELSDVTIAAWLLGLAVDLGSAGGVGEMTVVGPMSLSYMLAVAAVFRMREAFFRDRVMTQAILAVAFCLLAHGTWVTVQSALARGEVSWSGYGATLLQAAALACYTGALMPLGYRLLLKCERWFVAVQPGRARRGRIMR
jgi:rod shape-determining protein MreD